ncbi:MAG TPA: methyltransferase domain-containing protein [Chthoniobacterales bacterium]
MAAQVSNKWPKVLPPLSEEQQRISDDFMRHWHEVLPRRYGFVDDFNHQYPVRHAPREFYRTLEIGAGLGEHLEYEKLSAEQARQYVALELRPNMAQAIQQRFPDIRVAIGDCQARLPFPDGHFDRIIAVHVLEHLPMLPGAVSEVFRVCDKQKGVLSVVIPCEGGMAYSLARRISAQRYFEKRYKQSYRWFVAREHLNRPAEIIAELEQYFTIIHHRFFPLPIPVIFCNLCIGLTLRPKASGPA